MPDTYTPVLTDEEITRQKYSVGVIAPDDFFIRIARAIERAAIEAYQRQQSAPFREAVYRMPPLQRAG